MQTSPTKVHGGTQARTESKVTEVPMGMDYNAWIEMAEHGWEEEAFKNTVITVGIPLNTPEEIAKIVLVGEMDQDMNVGITKSSRETFPELMQLKGDVEIMELTSSSKRKGTISRKRIIRAIYNETEIDL
ncbi:hypothetical protein RI129_003518 [Pyrocoelia pectoralis]|uniref:Uncharacterized protein n=1 Tax=Pyrocoelia pectoralis TaxID=417401 RepID=A0AAN7VPL4_9COLE